MNIVTKYNFGDVVWNIWQELLKKFTPCEFCAGTGSISGANGESRACPECYRNCGKYVSTTEGWTVSPDNSLTIGRISYEETCEYLDGEDSPACNYGHQKRDVKEHYMCRQTGIGTGTFYFAENLFPTREEAQAECDKRNKEKK